MLLAGILFANAAPHLIKGITKEPFPTPFGSNPAINFVGGWLMIVLGSFLLLWSQFTLHPLAALVSGCLGLGVMGYFHATIGALGKR
jgi:hypothetical protein